MTINSNGACHNHPTSSADSLRFRRPRQRAKDRLVELFREHRSPAAALNTLKRELQEEYGEEYPSVAADAAIVPNLQQAH